MNEWVTAWETTWEAEAYLIKGFLEANGIPCVIESIQKTPRTHLFPVVNELMGIIKLHVPKDKLKEAIKLIEESNNSKE